ncbi:MAG TPA: hypothetical protein PKC20_05355, partial [Burkholderiaceae bacterium]|nr:hypothetical protein [Burkholderiaceae bacterium]
AARNDHRLWVVLANDARSLDQLRRELVFFAGAELPVVQLPDWEVLPYDQFSPLPDLVSERVATLARLPSMRAGILLVSTETLLQRLPPAGFIAGRSFQLAVGDAFSMSRVSEQLARAVRQRQRAGGEPGRQRRVVLRGRLQHDRARRHAPAHQEQRERERDGAGADDAPRRAVRGTRGLGPVRSVDGHGAHVALIAPASAPRSRRRPSARLR